MTDAHPDRVAAQTGSDAESSAMGGFDLGSVLAQASAMQAQLAASQQQAAAQTVEGRSGGGAVRVVMTGAGEVTAVHLDPSVVDPEEVDVLEDLIVAALHDAAAAVASLQMQAMGGIGEAMRSLLGGG